MNKYVLIIGLIFSFNQITYASQTTSKTLQISTIEGSSASVVSQRVMEVAYSRIGIYVEIIRMPGKTAIERSNKGIMDAELFRIDGIDKKFKNLIKVPVVINTDDGVVISKTNKVEVDGWSSIKDLYIGIKRGVMFSKNGTTGMQVIELDSLDQLMKMLEKQRINVVVNTEINALNYLADNTHSNIIINYPAILEVDLYHYIHKDNIDLLEPLTKALELMQASGEIEHIRMQYIQELSAR